MLPDNVQRNVVYRPITRVVIGSNGDYYDANTIFGEKK